MRVMTLVGVGLWISGSASGQDARATLRGVVLDASSQRTLAAVVVTAEEAGVTDTTAPDGAFEVGGLKMGTHVLTFQRTGFVARRFQLTLTENHLGPMEIGSIAMEPVDAAGSRVIGSVLDERTREPVAEVAVLVDGTVATQTGPAGGFELPGLEFGQHRIEVRRIGYAPYAVDIWVDPSQPEMGLDLLITPLPVQLADIVVEGDRTVFAFGQLREFHRRRRAGFGRYITHWEIEDRNPQELGDMLRELPGVVVLPSPGDLGRANRIRIARQGEFCIPIVFIDGVRLTDADADDLPQPQAVAGVEVYAGMATAPVQYRVQGTQCGLILVWTR